MSSDSLLKRTDPNKFIALIFGFFMIFNLLMIMPVNVMADTVDDQILVKSTLSHHAIDLSDAVFMLVSFSTYFDTNYGEPIYVELFNSQTPKTVTNFLNYVLSNAYENTIFHRSVENFIIQGGGFILDNNGKIGVVSDNVPVENEPGISNTRGTIAMAKIGGNPNSATNQWFFNVGDNSANLDEQNGGFTVFGKVINDKGLLIMDEINGLPTKNYSQTHSAFTDFPVIEYGDQVFVINANIKQISNFSFAITDYNPDFATVSISDNILDIRSPGIKNGASEIKVTATAQDGPTLTHTFYIVTEFPGDINSDQSINIPDVILNLKLLSKKGSIQSPLEPNIFINNTPGLSDAIYILQRACGNSQPL